MEAVPPPEPVGTAEDAPTAAPDMPAPAVSAAAELEMDDAFEAAEAEDVVPQALSFSARRPQAEAAEDPAPSLFAHRRVQPGGLG